jgi:hypothetical protein
MSIWKRLFGGGSKPPTTATPNPQQASGGKLSPPPLPLAQPETKKSTLETEVLAVATQPVPANWRTQDGGKSDDLRFTVSFPSDWVVGVTPDLSQEHIAIQPPSARHVKIDGKPMISPCVTVLSEVVKLRDNEVLDSWASTRAQQFQGFRLLESVKTTIQGMPTLLMSHEFTLGGESWNCLMALRVSGQAIWYADANGLPQDISSVRPALIRVIALLRPKGVGPNAGRKITTTPGLQEVKQMIKRDGAGTAFPQMLHAAGYTFTQSGSSSVVGRRGDDEIVIEINEGGSGLRRVCYRCPKANVSEDLVVSGRILF